ncbi:hypothetical protein M8R90_23785 [Enterobacter hormaechei]|nr:hypothetical protein [Enterobacter hormaechei]
MSDLDNLLLNPIDVSINNEKLTKHYRFSSHRHAGGDRRRRLDLIKYLHPELIVWLKANLIELGYASGSMAILR